MLTRTSIRCPTPPISHGRALTLPRPIVSLYVCTRRNQHSTPPEGLDRHQAPMVDLTRLVRPSLRDALQSNVRSFNQQYERIFGIAEVREIQAKVLDAEQEFVAITKRRKTCQDQIEKFETDVKGIRDKLEVTPRQSDKYLSLITEEHALLREKLSLEAQLDRLKESEQQTLDNMSRLLRHSHELERLRQERAKYWQIISISLSLAGSLVALIAQRSRNQRSVTNRLSSIDAKITELDQSFLTMSQQNCVIVSHLEKLDKKLEDIIQAASLKGLTKGKADQRSSAGVTSTSQSLTWLISWVPGLGTIRSLTAYLF